MGAWSILFVHADADGDVGLPANAKAVERLADPKRCLNDAFAASHAGTRHRASRSVHEMFGALGQQVALARLRKLQAFDALEGELTQALVALHVLD